MNMMLRSVRFLTKTIPKHWFILLQSSLVIGWFIWLFLADILNLWGIEIVENVGISSDMFGITAGSLATLSGALVGILITGSLIIMHYATSRISSWQELFRREGNYFDKLLEGNELSTIGVSKTLIRNLEKINSGCYHITHLMTEIIDWHELGEISEKTFDSFSKFIKKIGRKRARLEKEFQKSSVNNKPQEGKVAELELELQSIKKTVDICDDLAAHLFTVLPNMAMFRAIFMITDISHQMRKLAAIFSLVLVYTLILLLVSGLTKEGQVAFSDVYRLKWIIGILLGFISGIYLVFNTLSINWEIMKVLRGKVKD